MSSPRDRDIPGPSRWALHGGRRIHIGEEPRPGELVVAGSGEVSHKDLLCSALIAGRKRAIANGWRSGGFFAVSNSLADIWVRRCQVCLQNAAGATSEASGQPGRGEPGASVVTRRAAALAAAAMDAAPLSRDEASPTLCAACRKPVKRGQRRADVDGMPRHWSCMSEAERRKDRNTRLIQSGVTFASRRRSTYRRGKGPGSFR